MDDQIIQNIYNRCSEFHVEQNVEIIKTGEIKLSCLKGLQQGDGIYRENDVSAESTNDRYGTLGGFALDENCPKSVFGLTCAHVIGKGENAYVLSDEQYVKLGHCEAANPTGPDSWCDISAIGVRDNLKPKLSTCLCDEDNRRKKAFVFEGDRAVGKVYKKGHNTKWTEGHVVSEEFIVKNIFQGRKNVKDMLIFRGDRQKINESVGRTTIDIKSVSRSNSGDEGVENPMEFESSEHTPESSEHTPSHQLQNQASYDSSHTENVFLQSSLCDSVYRENVKRRRTEITQPHSLESPSSSVNEKTVVPKKFVQSTCDLGMRTDDQYSNSKQETVSHLLVKDKHEERKSLKPPEEAMSKIKCNESRNEAISFIPSDKIDSSRADNKNSTEEVIYERTYSPERSSSANDNLFQSRFAKSGDSGSLVITHGTDPSQSIIHVVGMVSHGDFVLQNQELNNSPDFQNLSMGFRMRDGFNQIESQLQGVRLKFDEDVKSSSSEDETKQ